MISLIAAIGGYDLVRVRNFKVFLECAAKQDCDDYEIVIAELVYDKSHFKEIVKASGGNVAYVELSATTWNRSRGYNAGARFSKGDTLIFMDADVVFSSDYLSAVERLFDSPYALGWRYSVWLNECPTGLAVGDIGQAIPGHCVDRVLTAWEDPCSCKGLSNVFRRDFFFNTLGGYNEAFTGWGAEDCEMMFRAKAMAGEWHTLPQMLIHLFHDGRVAGEDNEAIFKQARKEPEFVCETIKSEARTHHPDYYTAREPIAGPQKGVAL